MTTTTEAIRRGMETKGPVPARHLVMDKHRGEIEIIPALFFFPGSSSKLAPRPDE